MNSPHTDISDDAPISFLLLLVAIALLSLIALYQKSSSRRRLQAVRMRTALDVPPDKVILAWEIDGLLAEVSSEKRPDLKEIEVEDQGVGWCLKKVRKMLGRGTYYRPLISKK